MEGAQASRASILPTSVWGMERGTPQVENHLDCWGGRTSQSEAPPRMDSKASLMVVNIRTGLADVGGRTGENNIGKPGEGGYSLQMRVANLVQQHQRLLETLPWSTSSQKEGGPIGQQRRENPSRVTGTSGGSGERDATQPLRDKEEGLASVEVEANRGTEGPSLSTMWSAAERSPGGPTRRPN